MQHNEYVQMIDLETLSLDLGTKEQQLMAWVNEVNIKAEQNLLLDAIAKTGTTIH
jgi:hypothetical protein